MIGDACRGSHGDGVVAAENQRHQIFVERFANDFREALAGFGNFLEIFRAFLAVVLLFGLRNLDVADVFHLPAELLQARLQAGDAQRGRAHVHAAAAGAQVHRHTDDADFFRHADVLSAARTAGRSWSVAGASG